MRTDRCLNLKSKKQFGHSCSDFGHSTEHAKNTHFFLTLWLQDLYSTGDAKPGCIYPLNRTFFLPVVLCRQLADPRKGRWEADVPLPALMLLVVLAWVNCFTCHQYKHRCWCYQRLPLVCLFVCIKPVTGNPQAWEHPEHRAAPGPTAFVFTLWHHMSRLKSAPSLTHKMPETLQGNMGTAKGLFYT